ncbi:UDP-glucuronosyl/UDP-glucosyltransferase [Artemisia annua]|uniref:UDP-glucuronosyl/UDP-glucosyltransferase n=1 Tax=Artemisia annua TaxID=35608 RepID=A0A2U1NU76_ARTAN|nr:UDP-glucuronosyl/UDP-glucosyltransferase [Artemisia annua]
MCPKPKYHKYRLVLGHRTENYNRNPFYLALTWNHVHRETEIIESHYLKLLNNEMSESNCLIVTQTWAKLPKICMDNHEGEDTKVSTEGKPNNRRLVLFPLPFQGHIDPMFKLANILHTKDSPRIVLRTSSMSCIPVYAALPSLGEKDDFKTSIEEEWAPELALLTKKDIEKICNGESKESKLELISSMIKGTKAATGTIVITFKELEEPAFLAISHDFRIPTFPIDVQPNSSVVYVSFGSIAQLVEKLSLLIWLRGWLTASNGSCGWLDQVPFLEVLPKGFIEKVGERGRYCKMGSSTRSIAHPAIGAFWTRDGWSSTLESICEGVMLDNRMDREEIGRSIKRVIVDREGNEMRQRSKSLQEKVKLSLKKRFCTPIPQELS